MKKLVLLLSFLLLIFSEIRLYQFGHYQGEWDYKQSIHMNLALKSAYHFGYMDAKEGQPEDWDGEIEMKHHHNTGEILDRRVLIGDIVK